MITATIPQKPKRLPILAENIPADLKNEARWVCWRYVLTEKKDRWTKEPYKTTGNSLASSTDPKTWSTFEDAMAAVQRSDRNDGIGFMLGNGWAGVDLDKCFDAETGELHPRAREILFEFGTYAEISPSETGAKLFARGKLPSDKGTRKKSPWWDGEIELYDHARYFTVTGHSIEDGSPFLANCQSQIRELYAALSPPAQSQNGPALHQPSEPSADDAVIIEKARAARNGAKFTQLWSGDCNGYTSQSEADQALCNLLAFYCGPDTQRIDSLFRQSGLVRDKWTERGDYRQATLERAIANRTEFYKWSGNGSMSNGQSDADGEQPTLDVWQPAGRTEAANALRFIKRYGATLAYCDPHNAWYVFTGKRWQQDRERRVEALAAKMAGELWGVVKVAAEKEVDEKLMAELIRFAKSSNSANGIRNTLAMARSAVPVLPERFDADNYLLNCDNGTLELKTGKLRTHSKDDWCTKICPTAYNPDAPSLVFDCFLEAVFDGQQELIDFEQRYAGYCITGDVREQLIMILYGSGSNGKSTLLNAFAAVVGADYFMQAPHGFLMATQQQRHLTEQYDLRGRRCVTAVETGDGRRLDEELIKMLTGGESIRARKLYADHEEFPPTHKLKIGTNHKPKVRGTDHAIWRRIALVPFNVRFWNPAKGETGPAELRQDKDLPAKLAAEAEGILAWMVRGCLEWQKSGLRMPAIVAAATEDYRTDQDVIGRFVADCCIKCDGKTPFKQLYEALEAWCKDGGDNPPSRKAVAGWLESNGYERELSRTKPYRGIGLLAAE